MVNNAIFTCFSIGLVLICSSVAGACSCIPEAAGLDIGQKVRAARDEARAVFTGKVLSIRLADDERPRIVTLKLERSWKGSTGRTIELATGHDDGDCGFNFETGKTYLVYAHAYKRHSIYLARTDGTGIGGLGTSQCSRTQLISDVSKEELAALGSLLGF